MVMKLTIIPLKHDLLKKHVIYYFKTILIPLLICIIHNISLFLVMTDQGIGQNYVH